MLIKPKEITLTSKVGGETISKTYQIGRYPALEGVYMLGLVSEILDVAARNKTTGTDKLFATKIKDTALEACKYVAAKMPNGEFISLANSEELINAHVPDQEMLLQLVRAVHDYNSFFFSSERILKTSLGWMDLVKAQITKILTGLLDSLSAKNLQPSKSSKQSTTLKTK